MPCIRAHTTCGRLPAGNLHVRILGHVGDESALPRRLVGLAASIVLELIAFMRLLLSLVHAVRTLTALTAARKPLVGMGVGVGVGVVGRSCGVHDP